MDDLFYVCDVFQKLYLKKLFPKDLDVISVKYINKFIPRLIFPAFKIGIFLENCFIKTSSFFENPVVPITTLFNFAAIFRISKVHLGVVKSIIKSAFLIEFSVFKLKSIPLIFFYFFIFCKSNYFKVFVGFADFIICCPIRPMHPEIAKFIFSFVK